MDDIRSNGGAATDATGDPGGTLPAHPQVTSTRSGTRQTRRRPRRPDRARTLETLFHQWEHGQDEVADCIVLVPTVAEDPRGAPYIELLTGEPASQRPGLFPLWDEAQRACDATLAGRLGRPTVVLVPKSHRWTVARWMPGLVIPEAVLHRDPASALRAARLRFGEMLRRGGVAMDLEDFATGWRLAASDLGDDAAPPTADAEDVQDPLEPSDGGDVR